MANPLFDVPPNVLDEHAAKVQQLIIDKLRDERGVRIEDAISGAASLTGTYLLRSTGIPLDTMEPGSAVFGDAADELGQQYFGFFQAVCGMMNINPSTGWGGPVPAVNQPHKSVLQLTQLLEPAFLALCEEQAIPAEIRARVAIFTAARIIGVGRQVISPEIGKAIALESLVNSTKMVPHPLK